MIVTRCVDYVYGQLDLYDREGKPANAKVLAAWGFALALPAVLVWGFIEALSGGVSMETVLALGLVLGLPFGLSGYKYGVSARGSGQVVVPGGFGPAHFPAPRAGDTETHEATGGELLPPVAQSRPTEEP